MRTGVDLKKIKSRGATQQELIESAHYGEDSAVRQAADIAEGIRLAYHLTIDNAKGKLEPHLEKHLPQHIRTAWRPLEKEVRKALATGNANFFRAFARAIEITHECGVNPVAKYVGECLNWRTNIDKDVPTLPEMCSLLKARGHDVSQPALRGYYRLFGVEPPKGKPGVPRGKRKRPTRSPHRARRN